MTREDAERKIRAVFTNYFYFAGDREADEVIEALRQERKYCDRNICIRNEHNGIGCGECEVTKSQEPCEDAISRQAALDTFGLSEKSRKYGGDHSGYDTIMLYEVQDALEALPPVTPQQKTGHWIKTKEQDDAEPLILWKCSECLTVQRLKTNYCPNCGAKMEEQK